MKTKLLIGCLVTILLAMVVIPVLAQAISVPYGSSPTAEITQTIGLTDITVSYSRPRVIDGDLDHTGKIWGNQVHYGFRKIGFGYEQEIPWTAGSNKNTTITFEHDVKINGNKLSAGTYGFYMAIYENGNVTLIFSSNANSWESFWYHPDNDVLRVESQMEESPFTNSLTYSFERIEDNACELVFSWELKRIAINIEVDVHAIALASFEEDLKSMAGFGSEGPAAAARYLMEENIYLEQALIYAQWAINNGYTVGNLILKASILIKTGEEKELTKLLEEISNKANAWEMYFLSRDLITFEKPQKALDLLKITNKRHADESIAHLSLGEAYLANDQPKLAMQSAKKALELNPDQFVKSSVELLINNIESKQ